MEGWKRTKLGSVLAIQNGFAFDSKAFGSSGMPLIRIRDLKSGESTETRYGGEFDARFVVNAGDLLVGMDGEFACHVWRGEPALLNQRVCRLQGFGSTLNPRFLFYGINKHLKAIEDVTGFTTVKHLSSKQILEIDFFVPSMDEQRRIVAILDEAFEGIATAKAHAERNLRNAREVFSGHLERTFLSHPTHGWTRVKLEEIGSTQTGSTPRTSEPENFGSYLPFIKPGDFRRDGTLDYSNEGLSDIGASRSRRVAEGSALMVCIGATIGKAGFTEREVATNQQVNSWTPTGSMSAKFIYYQMTSMDFQRRVRDGAGQATLPIINKSKWSALAVVIPTAIEEQYRIVDELDAIQAETIALEELYQRKLASLDELKQSLLHQAFSGAL